METLFILLLVFSITTLPILVIVLTVVFLRKRRKKENAKYIEQLGECAVCNEKNVGNLTITEVTGVLLGETTRFYDDFLCPVHAEELYQRVKRHNLMFGWWFLRGITRVPFVLQENNYFYKRYCSARKTQPEQ